MRIIQRNLTRHVAHSLETDRVTALIGPRQAGKTTLVRHLLKTQRPMRYYNLKDPDVRQQLSYNARKEFKYYQDHIIVLDEVQQLPSLLELIQLQVDDQPRHKGRFLLLGSNHLLLNRRIKESLAGRVAIYTLLPLSLAEIAEDHEASLLSRLLAVNTVKELAALLEDFYIPVDKGLALTEQLEEINRFGSFPEFLTRLDPEDRKRWLGNYRQTYLDTDLRQLVELRHPESFEKFEKLFVIRAAGLLNISELARDCGVSADTIRRFLGYCRQLFVAWPAQPFHANLGKRMMKMSKWYFYDTGLMRSISGDFTSLTGNYFENTIMTELLKGLYAVAPGYELFYARTVTGLEADGVFSSTSGKLTFFVEIKQSNSSHHTHIRHLKKLTSLKENSAGLLVNMAPGIKQMEKNIWSIPAAWLFG